MRVAIGREAQRRRAAGGGGRTEESGGRSNRCRGQTRRGNHKQAATHIVGNDVLAVVRCGPDAIGHERSASDGRAIGDVDALPVSAPVRKDRIDHRRRGRVAQTGGAVYAVGFATIPAVISASLQFVNLLAGALANVVEVGARGCRVRVHGEAKGIS